MLPHRVLERHLQEAVAAALPGADAAGVKVRACPQPKFGDYQCAAMMALAKRHGQKPIELAKSVLAKMEVPDWVRQPVNVAGPGFLNFTLQPAILAEALRWALRGEHGFFEPAAVPRTVIVDFSSPNVAKPMHVGHIRSTILGDSLARVLRLLGHRVITDNHIGDWGTQFGKLIVGWKKHLDPTALAQEPLVEMERLYRVVHSASERDSTVLDDARRELVKLQNHDPENLAIWQRMIRESQRSFDTVYERLRVRFDHTLGESFYNDRLRSVVRELVERGIARESEGAQAVFFDDVPELRETPALIQKSDGAANYMTTDLATLEYRVATWSPNEILYVTDGRQQLHFRQLFEIFRRWRGDTGVRLVHVWFGSILSEDGTPFRTRSGETVRLVDLLDEAEERAFQVVTEKNPQLPEQDRRRIARIVGVGAVKYADLLPNRQSDYVFSWDKMLALSGNTAPYLQYAYTRICSIFRRGGSGTSGMDIWSTPGLAEAPLNLSAPEEIALAKQLLNFGLVLEAVAEDSRPNYLCNYLFDLAGIFARFYEQCPVLKADPAERESRLALCALTARVLHQGLDVLGIATSDQM